MLAADYQIISEPEQIFRHAHLMADAGTHDLASCAYTRSAIMRCLSQKTGLATLVEVGVIPSDAGVDSGSFAKALLSSVYGLGLHSVDSHYLLRAEEQAEVQNAMARFTRGVTRSWADTIKTLPTFIRDGVEDVSGMLELDVTFARKIKDLALDVLRKACDVYQATPKRAALKCYPQVNTCESQETAATMFQLLKNRTIVKTLTGPDPVTIIAGLDFEDSHAAAIVDNQNKKFTRVYSGELSLQNTVCRNDRRGFMGVFEMFQQEVQALLDFTFSPEPLHAGGKARRCPSDMMLCSANRMSSKPVLYQSQFVDQPTLVLEIGF